ncbi:AbrB/MazE/SpoVT family DNA-binding domain-containing protein [Paenibacillus lautus]|uniref:AbrB/MazE/SpoVT family DNA-binding domain-containing protein n=1 Tax=Paenibacillus lautus TaxID=1401 RepID=UPI001C7D1314|nr:AbrB/MazE/SpoVT family DNA-binding domain-containing protein [Paenibacillus lautus]MBX4145940.1 AbrB/MazE/SpoVT family DNA-binding domain-containing protein [Paenibacillus lautus]
MKATGIVRYLDSLGRVVVPKELRRVLDIADGSPMEIYREGDTIILKKYAPGCFICGETEAEKLKPFQSKLICTDCIKSVVEHFER